MGDSRLVIHVGTSKTGTTSIQGFLDRNEGFLAKQGFRFLTTGRKHIAHTPIHRALKSAEAPDLWTRIEEEMYESEGATCILSSEYFFSVAAAQGFGSYMPRHLRDSTRILVYLRRQDKYAESVYKQHVKVGRILPGPVAHYERTRQSYSYLKELSAHASVFGEAAIQVRPFERTSLAGGDVITDLMSALGLQGGDGLDRKSAVSNRSLSREATEVVGAIARNTGLNARQIMREMQRSGDARLMRSDDVYDPSMRKEMMEFYRESNAEIQSRFRPGTEGDLFDLSDLDEATDTSIDEPSDRFDRMTHAYEAAFQAIERLRVSEKLSL